jgi:hypothetical protein
MHAHLFSNRFGEIIEFHTASGGSFNRREFDELMHIHNSITAPSSRISSVTLSSAMLMLKCCLILPCEAKEKEIFRVGKHLHGLLKLQGNIYYRTVDTLGKEKKDRLTEEAKEQEEQEEQEQNIDTTTIGNTYEKMTEDSFRRYAKYRIKKEEMENFKDNSEQEKLQVGVDHFLAYQTQKKVEYLLQVLNVNGWDRRISS